MIPGLVFVGHSAAILCFHPCLVYRKIKLCIVMSVGWLREWSWRSCSDWTKIFQYNVGRVTNEFLKYNLQDLSTTFNPDEIQPEYCIEFNSHSPENWFLLPTYKEMFVIMHVENLCHIIVAQLFFQFCMDFATLEITTVKFPLSGINLCILHLSFPPSAKNGQKLNNWVFRKPLGDYSHIC